MSGGMAMAWVWRVLEALLYLRLHYTRSGPGGDSFILSCDLDSMLEQVDEPLSCP